MLGARTLGRGNMPGMAGIAPIPLAWARKHAVCGQNSAHACGGATRSSVGRAVPDGNSTGGYAGGVRRAALVALVALLIASACTPPSATTRASVPGTVALPVGPQAGALPSVAAFAARMTAITERLGDKKSGDVVVCPLGDPEAIFGRLLDLVATDAINASSIKRTGDSSNVDCSVTTSGDSTITLAVDIAIVDSSALDEHWIGFESIADDSFGGTYYTRCAKNLASNSCQASWARASAEKSLVASLGVFGTADEVEPLPTLESVLVGLFDNVMTLDPATITVDTTP